MCIMGTSLDVSHPTMTGGNLSFFKDNLYKLEYSFNSIERFNTPGQTGAKVKLKVDRDIVTNISTTLIHLELVDSPVIPGSYLDVVTSPYKVRTFPSVALLVVLLLQVMTHLSSFSQMNQKQQQLLPEHHSMFVEHSWIDQFN